jgi:hypothetical protein
MAMSQTFDASISEKMANDDDAERRKNERSAIEFPYGDLDGAISLARTLYQAAGTSAEHEQLAAQLGVIASAGGYRARLAPARVFGFITVERGKVHLTELGESVLESSREQATKVEAFLKVPLYSALYDKFKGKILPPTKGLENEIIKLGVSTKQADRARQVFEKSAEQAGFMAFGKDRLVKPNYENSYHKSQTVHTLNNDELDIKDNTISNINNYDFLYPLLKRLPPQDSKWDFKERVRWLLAASQLFDVVYKSDEEQEIAIHRKNINTNNI